MHIFVIGLNHRTAPVEIRERMAFSSARVTEVLEGLRAGGRIKGCLALVTCNRTEIYAVAGQADAAAARAEALAVLETFFERTRPAGQAGETEAGETGAPGAGEFRRHLYCRRDRDAVAHLFRVAAGLDSMVLGEAQILGQVKRAHEAARAAGAAERTLNTLFRQALTAGKRVQTETRVGRSAVSVSYVAVELARKLLGSLEGKTVLVVGAGKMSELAARYVARSGVSAVVISNRSYGRAELLAQELGGRAVRFDEFGRFLPGADIVICGTSATHYVVRFEAARAALSGKGRPTLFIDLAVPRDVDPRLRELGGVTLYDLDDLQAAIETNLLERRRMAREADSIIKAETAAFFTWLEVQPVVPTVAAIKDRAETVRRAELAKALRKLPNLTVQERKAVETLATSIAGKLVHPLIANLKRTAGTAEGQACLRVIREMLNLERAGMEESQ